MFVYENLEQGKKYSVKVIAKAENGQMAEVTSEQVTGTVIDLKEGDFVVHKLHGIGQFMGVNTITTADKITKDYIKIKYKNDDVLYIPTNDLDSIRKYIGGDTIKPKINRLGSKEWETTKAKVKNNLREIAKELIELYAKREKIQGFAFSKDTPWQEEFEAKFP